MSCIHYKFKSSLDYNSVTFDGLHLSLADLKKAIILQKRLKTGEFDLEITNAQTGDVYKRGDELIAKNTSVIVSRVPVNKTTASSTQKSWEAFKQECAKVKEKERQMTLEKQKQIADMTSAQASEIDKIKAVIDQSTKGFEPSNFAGKYQAGVPHENYVCKRCGQKGHFVSNCPNTNPEDRIIEPRYKRTTGIPSTMLTIVDDPMHPGALLTHHGQFAVPTVDVQGYRDSKKERPPFLPGEKQSEPEKKKIPQELLCHICEDLCVDAAIAPCCGTSFCDECLREVLLESDDHQCPSCKETNVSPDRIVANRSMRLAVTNFLNDTGYTKAKRRRSNSQGGDVSLPAALSTFDRPTSGSIPSDTANPSYNASAKVQVSPGSSPNINASPTYTESVAQKQSQIPGAVRPYAPRGQFNNSGRQHYPGQPFQGSRAPFNPQYNFTRPPRFPPNHHSKPWRYSSETTATETSSISTISRRNEPGHTPHQQSGSYRDEPPPASKPHQVDTAPTGRSFPSEPAAPGTTPIERSTQEPLLPKPTSSWSAQADHLQKAPTTSINTPISTLNLGLLLPQRMPLVTVPPAGHQPFTAVAPGFPLRFQGMRPGMPVMPQAASSSQPLSKEQFYQAKKMFQATDAPRKPVDVFESFADFTKRRSRTPERRRSYSRSRSGSWTKRSRSRSFSPSKRKSRSLSLRRLTSRSRSRSGPRSQNRSRSRSGPRSQNRTRSRSREPPRLSRQRSRTRSPRRLSKSRSRSRSGQRLSKALSPRARSPLPPLRRSSKSPLPLRSRSRSLRRSSRSRSKSWTKRARSRSHTRPRSPRRYSRSPMRSPRRSPLRSPLRKRSFSPRRRSRSYSPRRRSPFRSKSRTPLSKRRSPRSRTRSPLPKRRSFSPLRSPRRSKSPYKKPLSPIPFRRRSPSPFRGRGGYNRGRGRGGYRDYKDKRDDRFRSYQSPPRAPISSAPNQPLPNTNLPPVPYFPQMGLPPPEEYFKYNPAGYQEFVRNFYSPFGPQAQAWAQSQTFPQPAGEGFPPNAPVPNSAQPNQRPPWEPIPMSPSHRPRSITPPGAASRDRKAQNYQDRESGGGGRPWERRNEDRDRQDKDRQDRERQDRDRERDRKTDRGGRDMDKYRREGDRRDRMREDERTRGRDHNKDKENKEKEHARNRSKTSSDRKRSPSKKGKEEEKLRTKEKKKSEKKKDERDVKKSKKVSESEGKRETAAKESNLTKARVGQEELEAPGKMSKGEEKSDSKDALKPKNEVDSQNKTGEENTKTNVPDVPESEKPVAKEKKAIGKKKGDGAGVKKKNKEAGADTAVGEKKGKKIKKKKLTFGSSEADAKQGLKKKKLKRLVDYKSENYTSEEGGEERASLRGSPLKKAKHNASDMPPPEKTDHSHVSSSEPTFEVNADKSSPIGDEKKPEFELEAKVSQSDGDEKEPDVTGKGKGGMVPDLPELSKWERDDFDLFDAMENTKEKPLEKMMLPRSVVDKAEKFLTHKPMKNAVMVAQVTTSTKSPEPVTEKQTVEPKAKSPPQTKTSRRVFIDQKKDSKEKKGFDMQITVKSDKRREPDKKTPSYSKYDDHDRHHRHQSHHRHQDESDYEEDQRSVVKSRSYERELQDNKSSSKSLKEKEKQRKERTSRDSVSQRVGKEDFKRERYEKKERQPENSPEPRDRRHSKERKASTSTSEPFSKSSKDLRHKLEEKSKTKSAVDHRKLSVMDESEFIPDYEDLGIEGTSDNEQDDATTSQNSGGSSSETSPRKGGKKRKMEENNKDEDDEEQSEDDKDTSEEPDKHKKKKKHKEKKKEKKEKHKHKKKKHKHKKEKEGKKKINKGEES